MDFNDFTWYSIRSNDLKDYSSCIYCIRNLKNDKLYVGKTAKRLYDRIRGHADEALNDKKEQKNKYTLHHALKKHGLETFVVACIYLANPHDLNQLEQHFIFEFNSFIGNKHGYNMTLGGEGALGHTMSLESRQQISLKNKGVPMKESTKANLSKQVYQIDKDTNEIIAAYDSATQASKATGIANIGMCFNGKLKTAGGYIWRLVVEDDKQRYIASSSRKTKMTSHMQIRKRSMFQPVTQYDLEGHFIAEFESIDSTIEATGVKNISMVCRGVRNQAGGYFWKYA